jgi:hypothetical protein
MRVFCLLAVLGLIFTSAWLYLHDMREHAFAAALVVYLVAGFSLMGEALVPVRGPARPYRGESRSELMQRDFENLKKTYPNSKLAANAEAVYAAFFLGFLIWAVALGFLML